MGLVGPTPKNEQNQPPRLHHHESLAIHSATVRDAPKRTQNLGLQVPPQKVFGPSWHPPQSHLLRRCDWRFRENNSMIGRFAGEGDQSLKSARRSAFFFVARSEHLFCVQPVQAVRKCPMNSSIRRVYPWKVYFDDIWHRFLEGFKKELLLLQDTPSDVKRRLDSQGPRLRQEKCPGHEYERAIKHCLQFQPNLMIRLFPPHSPSKPVFTTGPHKSNMGRRVP